MTNKLTTCPTCGAPCTIEGRTTKYYCPSEDAMQRVVDAAREAAAGESRVSLRKALADLDAMRKGPDTDDPNDFVKGVNCPECGNPWWIPKMGGYVCSTCRRFEKDVDARWNEKHSTT